MSFEKLPQQMLKTETSILGSSTDAAVSSGTGRVLAEKFVREEGPQFHEAYSIAIKLDDQRAPQKLAQFKLYVFNMDHVTIVPLLSPYTD